MIHESIFTEVTITGITVYGLALLFVKAVIILILAETLSDQFEFSPASIRHNIWLIALISLVALPLLMLSLPTWHVFSIDIPDQVNSMQTALPESVSRTGPQLAETTLVDWLVVFYLLIVSARLLYLFIQIIQVGLITAKATDAGQQWYQDAAHYFEGKLHIKINKQIEGPVTWGILNPVILLPETSQNWSQLEREMVLKHECEHIRRADWLTQLLSQLAAVLYWPVPGIQKALRNLSLEAERACDNAVLATGVSASDYAALLLTQAKTNKLRSTIALGKSSELVQRIRHIVSMYVDRAGEKRARLLLSLGAMFFLIPFASIQAIGNISPQNSLAGMFVQPIIISAEKNNSTLTNNVTTEIIRPIKPITLDTPPQIFTKNQTSEIVTTYSRDFIAYTEKSFPEELKISRLQTSSAKLIARQQPIYPSKAQRKGIEGRVVVEFDLNEHGKVINPRIIQSTPSSIFNRSVIKAISQYQYEPYSLDGQPIGLHGLQEEFQFKLIDNNTTKHTSANRNTTEEEKHLIDSS